SSKLQVVTWPSIWTRSCQPSTVGPRSRGRLEGELGTRGARALVAYHDADAGARFRLDDPVHLRAVARRDVARPPVDVPPLDAAFELADLLALLARNHAGALRQLERHLDRPNGLPLHGLLRDGGREPARVLEHEP